jgi:hypothetical protein
MAKNLEARLTARYTQDTGQRTFWQRFFQKHPDLEESQDLVNTVLNSNFSALANKAIPEAIDELAGLTRQRIASYVKKIGRPRKAVAEGGGETLPARRPAPKAEAAYSLGSMIRARAHKRARAA